MTQEFEGIVYLTEAQYASAKQRGVLNENTMYVTEGKEATIPTKTSQLTNDSGFLTQESLSAIPGYTGAQRHRIILYENSSVETMGDYWRLPFSATTIPNVLNCKGMIYTVVGLYSGMILANGAHTISGFNTDGLVPMPQDFVWVEEIGETAYLCWNLPPDELSNIQVTLIY